MGVVVRMTHDEWERCHEDYRWTAYGRRYVMTPAADGRMILAAVEIVKNVGEASYLWDERERRYGMLV